MSERIRESLAPTGLGVHLLLLLALLFVLGWLSLSSLLFFSNDTGLRFLQARTLIERGWQTFAVSYPGHIYDTDFSHVPFYYAYVLIEDELFLSISPFFPLLLSGFYALLGRVGLVLLTVSSGVITALLLHWLAVQSRLQRPLLVFWTTVLATPILFYTLTLWDHGLATALAMGAVVAVVTGQVRHRPFYTFLAGVLAAFALAQRPEFGLFALSLAVALLVASTLNWRSFLLYGCGGVLGFIPTALLNTIWLGHPLGVVVAQGFLRYWGPQDYAVDSYGDVTLTPAIKAGRLLFYIQGGDGLTFIAAIFVLLAALLLIFGLRLPNYRKRGLFFAALLLATTGHLLWIVRGWNDWVTGVLSTFPLFPLSFAYVEENGQEAGHFIYRLVFLTATLFFGSMVLIWPSFGGNQWGARYLLPVYPLLLFLAWYAYQAYRRQFQRQMQRVLRLTFAGLVILSIFVQTVGVAWLYTQKYQQQPVRQALRALPADIVLTNNPFLPSFHAPLAEKQFLYVDDPEDLTKLIPRFADGGVERFALVTAQGRPIRVPDEVQGIMVEEIGPLLYQLEKR